jgi:uncharacterized protein YceK
MPCQPPNSRGERVIFRRELAVARNAFFASLLVWAGCASVSTHTETTKEVGAYSGVRADTHLLAHPNSIRKPPIHPVIVESFSLIDLPVSAALDTLLFPIDLTYRESRVPAALELEVRATGSKRKAARTTTKPSRQ